MFRVWHLKWQRYWTQRSFAKKYAELKKRNAPNSDLSEFFADEHFTIREIEGAIDFAIGSKLLDQARSLDVEVPPDADKSMWTSDEDQGFVWLTPKGRASVRKAIDQEKGRRFDVRTLWVTKIILPIAGILVGIIGAITGLVAVLKK